MGKLLDKLKAKIFALLIGSGHASSLIRHALSAAGVYLVSLGVSEEVVNAWVEPTTNLMAGLLMVLVAYVASRENKKL